MKNLKIASTFTTTGNNEITEILKGTQKVCVDTLNGDIYFAVGNHKLVVLDKNMMQSKVITIPLADFDIKDDSKISDLDFLYDDQRLCLIYEQGQILTMDAEALKLTKVCELGKRISGCAWSPESWGHQRLIIGTETCLFMLSKTSHIHESQGDFKILTEVSLRPTSSGKDQLVTVGWGSTETQFQGSAGKQNREKQNPNKIPIAIRGEFDDRKLLISWRSDGRFFAVSSVDELVIPRSDSSSNNVLVDKISCRQVRVWSRDLEFMSKCEFVSGMEAALCMRPTGNLIAVPRILDNDRFIWFFERNGQFRSKFKHSTLSGEESIGQTVVRRILWNLDSSILAIIFCNKDGLNQIQFWVVSNYSWMEKLRLDADTKVVAAFWDSKVASKFHHVTANGHYHQLSVQFEYDCEDILALSIDGGRLRVTDFRMATIPPPMCHYEIALDFAAAPSAFLHSPQHGLALIGSDYKYMLFFDMIDRKFLYRKYFLLAQNNNLLYNLIWKDYYTILALRRKNNATEIVEIGVDTEEIRVVHIVDFVQIYAQFIVNSRVDCKKSLPAVWHENSLNLRCRYIQTNIGEHQSILLLEGANIISDQICQVKMLQTGNQPLLFLLTKTSVFYVNGLKFHSSVGSFCFTNDFILLLTLENRLYCLPVNSLLKMLPNLTDPRQILTEGREIERGAQLVVSENNGTRVWFQMRRGNLELIHPREIVVRSLKRDLDCRLWRKVFLEMRRHRVDLNLLYDHNPKTFMEDLDDFVEQIGDVDQLNVFLTTLQPHDSTSRMFASQYPDRAHTQKTSETKINEICEKLRNILMNLPDEKRKIQFYPVVLTTFVVERPIKISTALLNMRDMLEQLNGESAQMGQRWLRHINYFVNDDTFLKEAMRTYDLEIVLMVAQAINMDPKEYLPILTALRDKSPAAYQQFHIDLFLENWDSALEHIAPLAQMQNDLAPTFLAECIEHIQQHSLFQLALKLFAGKPNFKEICKIVANDSEKHGHLKEAAILYRKAEDFAPALNCLLANQDFHGYLRLATSIGLPSESIEKALLKMVAHLMQKGEYLIAAEVFTYLGKESNAEKIIDNLSKAYAWKKLVAFVEECGSCNATLWDKCCVILATRCAEIIEQLDGWKDAIGKHLKRLEIVREEKANKLKRLADPNETNEDANDDETSSQSSQSSVASWGTQNTSTHKVSRRKRHIERKKQQIKEGSQWEDAALLVALKAIFIGINQQQEELVELMPALLAMDLVEKGRRLQSEMQSLLQFAESFVGTIWPEYLEVHQLPGPISDIYRNERGMWPITGEMPACIQLDDELHRPSLKSSRDWRLNIFE